MIGDRMMRASDEDRHMTVDLLRDAYCAGRLRTEEFYGRLDAAYEAMTRGELDDLTADLPPVWTDAGLPSEFVISQRRSRALAGERATGLRPCPTTAGVTRLLRYLTRRQYIDARY